LTNGYSLDSDYNVLYLDSYNEINDEALAINMIRTLLNCSKKLIVIDNKHHLSEEKYSAFVKQIDLVINHQLSKCVLQENTIISQISKSLSKYQIKTKLISSPLHLVEEYDRKYFGILIFENPGNTEFTLLNEYREFKSYDFPIVVVWLSSLVDDYNKAINEIVKGIRS